MDMLPFLLFTYRATQNRVTRMSPAELLYGRVLRPPYPALKLGRELHLPQDESKWRPHCVRLVRRLRLAWDHARQALQDQQLADKATFDSSHKIAKPFKENDSVLLFEPHLLQSTSKLTRGLAWTGPYRITRILPHNNVELRDLRDNRTHPLVHLDRLRAYHPAEALAPDMFVLDHLINARRVPAKAARGPSRVEFLVKWRQYTAAESTWEPMEELQKSCPEAVTEFLQQYPSHPALRSLTGSRTSPARARTVTPPATPNRSATQPDSDDDESEDPRPVAAKYERQMWFYLIHHPKGRGRVTSRWMPQHHFSVEQLSTVEMQDLRADHIATLSPERVAMVAALRVLGEP